MLTNELVNLLALEEFKRKVPYSIMVHINDKEERNLMHAEKTVDIFSLINFPGQNKRLSSAVRSDSGFLPDPGKCVEQS